MGKSGRKEKGVSKESSDKLHWVTTDQVLSERAALSMRAVGVSQPSQDSFFSFHSAPCGLWFFACNILPLLLPDDPRQTCRVHLHKNVSVLDCVTPSTEEGLSHSKLAAGITKTKPRHLQAPPRRCFGFPAYPPQHVWLRSASIWRPQEEGWVTLPRRCLFLFDSLHLYKITDIFGITPSFDFKWGFPCAVHVPSPDTVKQ